MSSLKKSYRYRIDYIKRGEWVPMLKSDAEDIDTFELVANAKGHQYRILCDGVDVTAKYHNT